MQKAQYKRIHTNLTSARKLRTPRDPRGKPISKSELLRAGRELIAAAKKWARILTERKRITEQEIARFLGE